ncbi:hypothetical protein M153_6105000649 [Pseudoloma neurophilia]|uniref:Uncharacterized protein n=1 Tax=Pseudoloma neurophilia TaxID=146866 RepID=A0A0R0M116_9MICR|nr:hypothetical protein M153_6105000649 [Pseudoloma neurophilia]
MMKTKELERKELECLTFMKNKDYQAFKYLFNGFQSVYEQTKTKYTTQVKASYLMILFSEDWQEYLYYLQKLDYEDLSDKFIQFILKIEIILGEKNIDALKKERGKIKEFDDCLEKIILFAKDEQNKKYKMEQLVSEEIKENDPMTTIKQCLKFSKKFNKV